MTDPTQAPAAAPAAAPAVPAAAAAPAVPATKESVATKVQNAIEHFNNFIAKAYEVVAEIDSLGAQTINSTLVGAGKAIAQSEGAVASLTATSVNANLEAGKATAASGTAA